MTKWAEIALYVAGAVLVTYVTMSNSVSQHSYRLDKLEKDFSQHLDEHHQEYKEIQATLLDIQLKLAKLNSGK